MPATIDWEGTQRFEKSVQVPRSDANARDHYIYGVVRQCPGMNFVASPTRARGLFARSLPGGRTDAPSCPDPMDPGECRSDPEGIRSNATGCATLPCDCAIFTHHPTNQILSICCMLRAKYVRVPAGKPVYHGSNRRDSPLNSYRNHSIVGAFGREEEN